MDENSRLQWKLGNKNGSRFIQSINEQTRLVLVAKVSPTGKVRLNFKIN